MPIYAYKCATCGHAQDVLQKISDAPLTVCPACGEATYAKQVTAAGFQLKGSGWYVTDFRDGGKKKEAAKDAKKDGATEAKTDGAGAPSTDGKAAEPSAKSDATAPAPSPSPPPAPPPTTGE